MFYDDDLGTEIFFPVCLKSEYASVTINVYLYSIHLGIWNVTAVFQFPFNLCHACKKSTNKTQYEVERHPGTDIHSRLARCGADRNVALTFAKNR